MKKNMLTVLVLVLTIVNLSLSAFIVFTVVPNIKRTDELVINVAKLVGLELEDKFPEPEEIQDYEIKDLESFALPDLRVNLKAGADGKTHYAQISNCSISMNTEHDDYGDLSPKLETLKSNITQVITSEVGKYTYEEISDVSKKDQIRTDILGRIQDEVFQSKFVVNFTMDILSM